MLKMCQGVIRIILLLNFMLAATVSAEVTFKSDVVYGHKDGMALNDLAAGRAVDGDVLVVDRILGFSKEEGGVREGAVKVVHRHIP